MEWSAIAVAIVVAGGLLFCCALLPLGGRDRVFAVLFGVATVMAGLNRADQPAGAPVFSTIALLLALVAIGYLLVHANQGRGTGSR